MLNGNPKHKRLGIEGQKVRHQPPPLHFNMRLIRPFQLPLKSFGSAFFSTLCPAVVPLVVLVVPLVLLLVLLPVLLALNT